MIDFLVPLSKDIWELVYGGHIERLRAIFATEPERARIESNGHTPLMWLPTFDEALAIDIAQLLVQHGADTTKRNNRGETAEMRARALGMYDLAAVLAT